MILKKFPVFLSSSRFQTCSRMHKNCQSMQSESTRTTYINHPRCENMKIRVMTHWPLKVSPSMRTATHQANSNCGDDELPFTASGRVYVYKVSREVFQENHSVSHSHIVGCWVYEVNLKSVYPPEGDTHSTWQHSDLKTKENVIVIRACNWCLKLQSIGSTFC